MRELLIARMKELLTRDGNPDANRQRWMPVKDWILKTIMQVEPAGRGKTHTKQLEQVNLSNLALILFTANVTNEQVIELYELIYRRRFAQY